MDVRQIAMVSFVTVLGGLACSTYVTRTWLNEPVSDAQERSPSTVEVFTSGPPPQPHVDVALLHAEAGFGQENADVIASLRAEAARMGCDAIVIAIPRLPNADATCVAYK
jgi:hypothetical protein